MAHREAWPQAPCSGQAPISCDGSGSLNTFTKCPGNRVRYTCPVTVGPDDDPVWPEKVLDCRAFFEKFGIRDHVEGHLRHRRDFLRYERRRSHGHRALVHNYRIVPDRLSDLASGGKDVLE